GFLFAGCHTRIGKIVTAADRRRRAARSTAWWSGCRQQRRQATCRAALDGERLRFRRQQLRAHCLGALRSRPRPGGKLMFHRGMAITRAAVGKPGDDGVLAEGLLTAERRSRKVGILPTKARLVVEAARRCLDPDLTAGAGDRDRIGVSLGTVFGSMDSAELCLVTPRNGGFGHVMPSWYATGLPNATAAIVPSMLELQGPNLSLLGYSAGLREIGTVRRPHV